MKEIDSNAHGDAQVISLEHERRFREQIRLADHIAHLGGRHVLEALRAVRRGQKIESVLEEFQKLPRWRGVRVAGVSA